MAPAVVAHAVPTAVNLADEFGMAGGFFTNEEEGRFDLELLKETSKILYSAGLGKIKSSTKEPMANAVRSL